MDIAGHDIVDISRDLEPEEPPHKQARAEVFCQLCSRTFTERRSLLRHQREQHGEVKEAHACPTCGKSFARESTLRRHVRESHEGQKRHVAIDTSNTADAKPVPSPEYLPMKGPVLDYQTSDYMEIAITAQQSDTESSGCSDNKSLTSDGPTLVASSHSSHHEDDFYASDQDLFKVFVLPPLEAPKPSTNSDTNTLNDNCIKQVDGLLHEVLNVLYLDDTLETKVGMGASKGTHTIRMHECPTCRAPFTDGVALVACMESHVKPNSRIHLCRECDFGFARKEHLDMHLRSANRDINPHCGFMFDHACTGHHNRQDAVSNRQMNMWYLCQLSMKATKRGMQLGRMKSSDAQDKRWSSPADAMKSICQRFSLLSVTSSLNTDYSMPAPTSGDNGSSPLSGKLRWGSERPTQAKRDRQLLDAVLHGNDAKACGLIGRGADVHQVCAMLKGNDHVADRRVGVQYSLLYHALCSHRPELAATLLKHGADPRNLIPGFTLVQTLCHAYKLGHDRVVTSLVSHATQPAKLPEEGSLILHAVYHGLEETLAILLETLQPPNSTNTHLDASDILGTGLCHAAHNGQTRTAQLLIEAGADIWSDQGVHGSPVRAAAAAGHLSILQLFVDHFPESRSCIQACLAKWALEPWAMDHHSQKATRVENGGWFTVVASSLA